MTTHARIDLNTTGGGVIELDGVDLSRAVSGVQVTARPNGRPQLVLAFAAGPVLLESDVDVELGNATKALLVSLGWTPPETPATPSSAT